MNHDIKKKDLNIESDKDSFNILFVTWDNNATGGAFISMVDLINNLKKNHDLNIFVIVPHDYTGSELLKKYNIPFSVILSGSWIIPISDKNRLTTKFMSIVKRTINNIYSIRRISKFIKDNNIDLVHINNTYTYVGAKCAIKTHTPFVWHLRECVEEHQNNTMWNRDKANQLINQSDKIIVISESLKKKYINILDNDKLTVIYDGIDADIFYNPTKEIFKNNKLIFLSVGHICYPKGQVDLAKACAKLHLNHEYDFEVWFLGEGEDYIKQEIKDIFDSVNFKHYKFFGFINEINDYYEKADILFNCSEHEAFGRTTVEAMLSGNLVIGANSGGTKELINEKNGFLFELHNSDDLYEKIIFALENQELSKNIADNARKFMYENMSSESKSEEVFKLYNEILSNKR